VDGGVGLVADAKSLTGSEKGRSTGMCVKNTKVNWGTCVNVGEHLGHPCSCVCTVKTT